MRSIKRYFFTGFLVILPVFITVYFLFAIFRFIDGVWGAPINFYLKRNFGFALPGVGFILGLVTVFVVGFITTNILGKRLFQGLEHWFLKFPFVRMVYPSAKQVVESFISKDKPAFKKVVLVEYPSKGIWSVGFITNEGFSEAREKTGKDLVHVFIATTPSPFTGFLVLVPREDVKYLDMSVEDGVKIIVSGGILKP